MKKISIIIPVYNCEKYIKKCIESILNQTLDGIEIIIVDDGSNDNSYSICKSLSEKNENIILIKQKNKGVSSARNLGINKASGKYIGFVDSDDIIKNNMYESLYNIINSREDIDIVACWFFRANTEKSIYDVEYISNKNFIEKCCNTKIGGYVCNKLFKRQIIIENNLKFDEEVHVIEDFLFCLKYIENCRKGAIYNKELYNYIYRENSVTKQAFNKKRISALKAYKLILESKYINEDSDLKFKIEYEYLKYCLWLAKSMVLVKYNNCDKEISNLKSIIKNMDLNIIKNKNINIKYKLGLVILFTYPKLFFILK